MRDKILFNVETTGLCKMKSFSEKFLDKIPYVIKVGMYNLNSGESREFNINNGIEVPKFILELLNTPQDVFDSGLSPNEAAKEIKNFTKNSTLINFNKEFNEVVTKALFFRSSENFEFEDSIDMMSNIPTEDFQDLEGFRKFPTLKLLWDRYGLEGSLYENKLELLKKIYEEYKDGFKVKETFKPTSF